MLDTSEVIVRLPAEMQTPAAAKQPAPTAEV
jgi:hypothetical protein